MGNNTYPPRKSYSIWIIIFIVVVLFATLPFHYALDYGMIFPKEHLTFSNTFITEEDVDKVIERFNNANFIEQQAIRQEPLARKLMEKGLIHDKEENQQKTDSAEFDHSIANPSSEEKLQEKIVADISNFPEVKSLNLTEDDCGVWIVYGPNEESAYYCVYVTEGVPCSRSTYIFHVYNNPKYEIKYYDNVNEKEMTLDEWRMMQQ